MIGYFPEAYPDELLYSICARCHDRLGYLRKQSIVQELFGTRTVLASIELPSHLDALIAALPMGNTYNADQLIDNHTLLPFYGPFLPPSRLDRIRQDMHGNNGPTIHMRAGIMASRVALPRWLRFCPLCVQDDRKQFGKCYWHRIHQVPGVEVCPLHHVHLQNSSVPAQNRSTRYEFLSAEQAIQGIPLHNPLPLSPDDGILLHIALDAQWLLHQHSLSEELESLSSRYCKLLVDRNLATHQGRVSVSELQQQFKDRYSPQMLELLHCELDDQVGENWLSRIVRKPDHAQHPLHHLLLIHFLGHTVEAFFKLSVENNPFGEGPWPCLNPVCQHYRQCSIKECQIVYSQYSNGKPRGTFSCTCGYTYSRIGPDTSPTDCLKWSRVNAFGDLWEGRLRILWEDETVSLRGMARQLGADPMTVKRHATQLGLAFPRPVGKSLPLQEAQQLRLHKPGRCEPSTRDAYRMTWRSVMQEDLEANLQVLRRRVPGIYAWLYRNDKEWLKEHYPTRKAEKAQRLSLDWERRDHRLAQTVKDAANSLKVLPGPPVRVSFAAIGRSVGQLALLQQHLGKLPLTAKALNESVETREMFAVRKIHWTTERYREEQLYPARWQVIKRAGVERMVLEPLVKEALDTALVTLAESQAKEGENAGLLSCSLPG
jgi:hypothetical protein